MQRSSERILTTHTGSLPRTEKLRDMMIAVSRRETVDASELAQEIEAGTRRVVRSQVEAGIDVGNNGEQARESFVSYVQHRLSGYSGEGERAVPRDIASFQSFVRLRLPNFSRQMVSLMRAPKATGEVRHQGLGPIRQECGDFLRIAGEATPRFAESFMAAASPGIIAAAMLNEYYGSYEEYVNAVADAMRPEYGEIVSQGLVLQLDCPDLAMERHVSCADRPIEEFLDFVEANVAALNRAIEGLPADRIRMHVCWGNYEAPHHLDTPLEPLLPLIYQARVGALVLPFANPRHAHEWRALEKQPPPSELLLVAGVIDTTTNYVEHPEVVADRIEQAARAIGDATRIIAGTDCGFDTSAGLGDVADEVVWEKLAALRDGADVATERLLR